MKWCRLCVESLERVLPQFVHHIIAAVAHHRRVHPLGSSQDAAPSDDLTVLEVFVAGDTAFTTWSHLTHNSTDRWALWLADSHTVVNWLWNFGIVAKLAFEVVGPSGSQTRSSSVASERRIFLLQTSDQSTDKEQVDTAVAHFTTHTHHTPQANGS